MPLLFEAFLFCILLIIGLMIVRSRNLFIAVMLAGIFSLLCTGIYTLFDAVDVAFTEAAVGAGVSTVLFLGTLALTGDREEPSKQRPWTALAVVFVVGALLLYGTLEMPAYGDYSAPIHHHVVPRYIEASPQEIGLPNFVTSILASYRGYDTFGETTVVFTAAVGVLALLGGVTAKTTALKVGPEQRTKKSAVPGENGERKGDPGSELESAHELPELSGAFQNLNLAIHYTRLQEVSVIRVVAKLLTPFILLFALYVQFHGDFGPGGGFQAGVIFAAGLILYALVFGPGALKRVVSARAVEIGAGAGVLLYGGTGVYALLNDMNFLDYYALGHHGQHWGIFLVELGVGITVTSVMLAIFYALTGRART